MLGRAQWTIALMLITLGARAGAYTVPYEGWMGAYIGDSKVGYLSLKIDETELDGVAGYRIASVLNNRLRILGVELTQVVTTIVVTDKHYKPRVEDLTMTSGGRTTRVRATFRQDSVECVISAGSGVSTKSVSIPEGANLVGDALFAISSASPEIGSEYLMHYFNPLTLAIEELKVRVERRESLTVDGKDYESLVLRGTTPMGAMTVWQDDDGDILQVDGVMGIRMVRETREQAVSGVGEGSAEDFAVLTSVKTNKTIPSPRTVRELDIVLGGIVGDEMLINDSRQKARRVQGSDDAVRFQIAAVDFDSSASARLPIVQDGLSEYLSVTPYIDHDVSAVRELAREISGDVRNAYEICSRIRAWLHSNLRTRADIGITRSASDVLKSKEGVCRDYAILFAALARAAGVPSRIAAGLMYTDGAFFYHAWTECWTGEWVAFDATLPTDFVDGTHIKLAEGDATAMFGLARVIGSLSADVKGFK